MKKIYIKFSVFFFIGFFVCLIISIFLPANKISAATLEVPYPSLQKGTFVTTQSDLAQYLKDVFDIGIFAGFFAVFLSLIWAGVLWFLSPAIPEALGKARDRISGAISGLLILTLLYLIITTINPWLSIFNLNKLEKIPPPEPNTKSHGVSFYKSQNCSGVTDTNLTSVPDLGSDLTNKINSVGIVQNPDQKIYYFAILYDNDNYWGKCQYIHPDAHCTPITPSPFAASASIYQYDFNPDGDGVYIYRESFNGVSGKEENKKQGFLKISNSQIKNLKIAVAPLSGLKFTGNSTNYNNLNDCTVPESEQTCIKYNENMQCIEKECPNLSGENISSIKIAGNYLVLFVYFSPSDKIYEWSYCQAYPTLTDINKDGPQQIKWDAIRNRGQNPNFIIIIPVAKK